MTLQQCYSRKLRLTTQLKNSFTALNRLNSEWSHRLSSIRHKVEWIDVLQKELKELDKLIDIILFEEDRLKLMYELLELKVLIANGDEAMVTSVKKLKEQYKGKLRKFMEMNEISIRRDRTPLKMKLN